ncbi:hypothetical protein BEWA_027620 [Theileria equi strain WA]|uniref:Uncharacterized protein n=1 Tax=Theileria equi strain WA TaxID=1537102 RepID=L0AXF7_THEEQ|nr:hypothetical protein BEWA_027620 [Theileria equi strain WA]AFZ79913.1 hypothetical protein BEWA_027620 [Theileria equi strain WA]|eukprot:XP_004829579.1 hypothetical protein BEWA_027620 [Theileria equi strain WA]
MSENVVVDIYLYPVNSGTTDGYDEIYYSTDGDVKIVIETDPQLPGYKRVVHTPKRGGATIGGILEAGVATRDFDNSIKTCHAISVYYWTGDLSYTTHLIVQLDGGYGRRYYAPNRNGMNWIDKTTEIERSLIRALDMENCNWNRAHVLDVLGNRFPPFNCYTCFDNVDIDTEVSDERNGQYRRVTYSLSDLSYIGRFMENGSNIIGIDITEEVSTVYIYWHPSMAKDPLLIHIPSEEYEDREIYDSGAWYQRVSSHGHRWEQVKDIRLESKESVFKLIQTISRMVSNAVTNGIMQPKVQANFPESKRRIGWNIKPGNVPRHLDLGIPAVQDQSKRQNLPAQKVHPKAPAHPEKRGGEYKEKLGREKSVKPSEGASSGTIVAVIGISIIGVGLLVFLKVIIVPITTRSIRRRLCLF